MNTGTVYVGGSHTIQCRTYLGLNPGFWITKSKPTHTLTLKYMLLENILPYVKTILLFHELLFILERLVYHLHQC